MRIGAANAFTWVFIAQVIFVSAACIAQESNLFAGRTITITIACERAGTGNWSMRVLTNGDIHFTDSGRTVQIVNDAGSTEYMSYSASVSGSQLTVKQTAIKLAGVSFTEVVKLNGNSCSAQHFVEPGQYADSIDPSCRATRCVITPPPRPTTPQPSAVTSQKSPVPSPATKATPPTVATAPKNPTTAPPTSPSPSPQQARTAAVPTPRVSCGSTITGANLTPAPKEQCDKAQKWHQEARAARKSWFGSKEKAEPLYKQAAQVYREAGDNSRADLALEESQAEDVTVYERAERDAADRPKNLKEAENQKDIARKIELGAYDSKSCGDLLKAAEYYFEAARLYLKADQFQATNALLRRHDDLVAIVDDAKSKGLCDGRVRINWTNAPPEQADPPPRDDAYCKRMSEFFARKENQKNIEIAAYKIEIAPICKGIVEITDRDCRFAYIHWMDTISKEESTRKRRAAGCKTA